MKRAVAILAVLFGLSACAAPRPDAYYQLSPGDRVGIMVDVGDTLYYTISRVPSGKSSASRITVKRYPGEWGIRRYVTERLTGELRGSGGFEVVDLASHGFAYYRIAGLIGARDGQWAVRPNRGQIYQRLLRQLRLKAVVVVTERRTYVTSRCTEYGCVNYYSTGHGLVRVSGDLTNKYYAVAAYQADVFILDPPANPGLGRAFKALEKRQVGRIRGFRDPRDPKKIPVARWRPVIAHLHGYVKRLAVLVSNTLRR